jgi:outer membrane lipoprotein-sorting protein
MKRILITIFLVTLAFTLAAETAEEIVRRADESMQYESAYTEVRMVNIDRFGEKVITYKAWAKGSNFLMEFTSNAEFGQKILRTEDRIYHFFPDSETVFAKSKGDSVVGLISYDDITDESGMLDNYDVSLEGEEMVDGDACYNIRMQAKSRTRVAYPIQLVWIEKETYIIRRIEMFTRSNKALKTMEIRETAEFDGKLMATDLLISDEVRRGVTSEMYIDTVELNPDIPDSMFTRRELTR